MKPSILLLICMVLLGTLLLSGFQNSEQTSIIGRINPIGGANTASAVSGRDSSTSNIVNGAFSFALRQGVYKVTINANKPYKNEVLENIGVSEGQTVDVGEITLQK